MTSHLSQLELVALVSLASAIGFPLLAPDRGLLPALLISLIVVGITWLIAKISFNNKRFEDLLHGTPSILIENAVMSYKEMEHARISRERLFAHLRSEGILHTGEVKRVYLETNGAFCVLKNEAPEPGLMVIPDWNKDFATKKLRVSDTVICKNCGQKKSHLNRNSCHGCGEAEWVKAVIAK